MLYDVRCEYTNRHVVPVLQGEFNYLPSVANRWFSPMATPWAFNKIICIIALRGQFKY